MERQELKDLGLDDSQVASVMKLHGQAMTDIKDKFANYDELKATNDSLTAQVDKYDKDLKGLRKKYADYDDLSASVKDLQKSNKQLREESDNKIAQMKLDNSINNALTKVHARDITATRALLDMDSIKFDDKGALTGLDNQLSDLQTNKTWLFDQGENQNYKPKGGQTSVDDSVDAQFNEAFGITE